MTDSEMQAIETVSYHRLMAKPPTMAALLATHLSLRRMMDNYWHGLLSAEEERVIESFIEPAERVGYKPLEAK